jgi:hypothetical protein
MESLEINEPAWEKFLKFGLLPLGAECGDVSSGIVLEKNKQMDKQTDKTTTTQMLYLSFFVANLK